MPSELAGRSEEPVLREAFRRILERNLAFCLVVSDGISERIFYFAIGGIRVIASGPRNSPSLGDLLIENGVLTAEDRDRVTKSAGDDPGRWAESALRMGVCSAAAMQEAVGQQVETELLDLFFWDCAEISLVEGQPPKSFYDGRFQTAAHTGDVTAMLRGVLEKVDVWRKGVPRLPGGRDAFEATEKSQGDLRGKFGRLLRHLDGTHTLADAIEKAGLRRVPSFEYAVQALEQGKIRRAVGSAAQRVGREQMMRDVELLEEALLTRADSTFVRRRLARTLEALGESTRASAQWRSLGDAARKSNDLDRALECYSDCVRVLPTDFTTRELILEIHRHRKELHQVVAHGRPLADLFVKHNLLNRAKHLLLQLVAIEPSDPALRRSLILVLIGLGERELALRHLRELARILEGRKAASGELKDVYVRILALDARDRAARLRLDELTGISTQRRVVKVTAAATAATVVAAGALFWFEGRARAEANDAIVEARDRLAGKDIAGARRCLQAAAELHPSGKAGKSIQGFLERVEELQRKQLDRAAKKQKDDLPPEDIAAAAAKREREESDARDLLRDAADLAARGRTTEAHKIYEDLLRTRAGTIAVSELKVRLALTVLPASARVLVDGNEVGRGKAAVEYNPSRLTVLEIEADGYERQRIELTGLQKPSMTLSLHRPLRWSVSFDAAIETTPLAAEGVLLVAGRDRFVTALSIADGTRVWRTPLGLYSDAGAAPVVAAGVYVVATEAGEAVALERATGQIAWRRAVGASVSRPVTASGSSAVFVPADGSMTCLDAATGEPRWSAPERSVSPGAAPFVLVGGDLAWIEPRGALRAADFESGRPVQRPPISAVLRGTPVAGGDDRIWAFAEDESLRVLSASSGTMLRRLAAPRAYLDVVPELDQDRAFFASQDGTVHGVRADGEVVLRRRLDQPAPGGVTVANGRVYAGCTGGELHVLDAASGEELWRFDAGSRITARPLVVDGTIYIVTAAGRVFALAE